MTKSIEDSDNESPAKATSPPPQASKKVVKSKWEGEDEEDAGPVVGVFAMYGLT